LWGFGAGYFLNITATDIVLEQLQLVLLFDETAGVEFVGHALDLDALQLAFGCGEDCGVCGL
jgi:hypothetical protein